MSWSDNPESVRQHKLGCQFAAARRKREKAAKPLDQMKIPGQSPFWGLLWRGTKKGQKEEVYIMYGVNGPLQFWRKKDAEAHARQVYGDGKALRVTYSRWRLPKAVKVTVEFTIQERLRGEK